MNCYQCGAPMNWDGQRPVVVCDYCCSLQTLPTGPASRDRVQPMHQPSPIPCPRCLEPLVRAALDGCPVELCLSCHGVLVEKSVFGHVVRQRRAAFEGADGIPVPINPAELRVQIACPACHKGMEVHPYYGPGNVVIDSCSRCQLVWLDHGELASIEIAPGARM